MAAIYLASAGDDIRLWDVKQAFSLSKQISPHDTSNVTNLTWSPDNLTLTSSASSGDKIACTYVNSLNHSYDLAVGDKQTCVALNSTARYVVAGGLDGVVHVWDLKTKAHKRAYTGHTSAVTSVSFNGNDTDIASASEKGEIILFNVVSGTSSGTLTTPKTQAIRQVAYSKFKKSLLASVSDDGAVNLWDTNRRSLIHSFADKHRAPATGLAFSPLNEMLLISVGLDKRIICYDLQKKTTVKTIFAESPLTSVDVMYDGVTLAVGSIRGKIYVYDLKKGLTPLSVISAHKSSVQALRFQHSVTARERRVSAPAGKRQQSLIASDTPQTRSSSTNSVAPVKNGHSSTDINANSERLQPGRLTHSPKNNHTGQLQQSSQEHSLSHHSTVPNHDHSDSIETHSPLRNTSGQLNSSASLEESQQVSRKSQNISYDKLGDNVFSPLAADASRRSDPGTSFVTDRGYSSALPRWTNHNAADSGTDSSDALATSERLFIGKREPLSSSDSETSTSNQAQTDGTREHLYTTQRSSISSNGDEQLKTQDVGKVKSMTTIRVTEATPVAQSSTHQRRGNDQRTSPQVSLYPSPRGAALNVPMSNTNTAAGGDTAATHYAAALQPNQMAIQPNQTAIQPNQTAIQNSQMAIQPSQMAIQPIQTAVIREIVEDAMEEFRDQVHDDVLNLQMNMFKQFQLQQAEMRSMLEKYSVNAELLAEVERLREENKRLKQTF